MQFSEKCIIKVKMVKYIFNKKKLLRVEIMSISCEHKSKATLMIDKAATVLSTRVSIVSLNVIATERVVATWTYPRATTLKNLGRLDLSGLISKGACYRSRLDHEDRPI